MDERLSDAEIMKVYQTDEQEGIRLMVEKYQNYVWHVINTYYHTYQYDNEDLFQCGVIGMIEAMSRFKPEKGTFTTYCTPFMKKEIGRQIQFLKSETSEYYASINNAVNRALSKLEAEGLDLTVENVMKETNLSEKIVMREMKIDWAKVSLDAAAAMESHMTQDEEFVINDILSGITEEGQKIVRMRALENMTYKQIAHNMRMSVIRVQRTYQESIDTLRTQMY